MARIHAATVRTNMIDEVVFLRHGRTAFNVARRLQGQIDVPLDVIGQWQADQSASELARRYYWAKVANIARHPDTLAQPGPGAAKSSDIEDYRQASGNNPVPRCKSSASVQPFTSVRNLSPSLSI